MANSTFKPPASYSTGTAGFPLKIYSHRKPELR
jgi:hypothetical protein